MQEEAVTGQAEGALGTPPAPPAEAADTGGFDPLLLALLLLVAGLVAVQNIWLRRRARRERSGG